MNLLQVVATIATIAAALSGLNLVILMKVSFYAGQRVGQIEEHSRTLADHSTRLAALEAKPQQLAARAAHA